MSSLTPGRSANRLIMALPREERLRFVDGCRHVHLEFEEVLAEPGKRIRQVHFPTASFISMIAPIDAGATLEVGLVGNEGMLGTPLILGVEYSPLRSLVQGAGSALRMEARRFRVELARSSSLRRLVNRYLYVLMAQLAGAAACNRFHVVEARLARWLLMTQDRAHASRFRVTHEFLAFMLGVRRVGVTQAATALQRGNLISYHRGDVTVLDRAGLETASCSCYAADKAIYSRSMAGKPVVGQR